MLHPAVSAPPPPTAAVDGDTRLALDPRLQGRLWRGSSLGRSADPVLPSGFAALDAELPGGGWPLRAVTELLLPQPGVLEWRLLAPGLRAWWAAQTLPAGARLRTLLLINPPHMPHLPGLQALGLPPAALVWVAPRAPAEALWAAEQAIKSRVAVLAWLAAAQPEQIRRLQVGALGLDAPAFLLRPEHASQQSSAAPLRLIVKPGDGWALDVHLLKRRGPAHDGWLALDAPPPAVAPLLAPARRPALTPPPQTAAPERSHALARPVLQA